MVQFKLSDIGEGIAEVSIKEWYVSVGQAVNQFDSICEVQSDKASVTITSKFDGVIKKIHYDVDDVARVGQPLVDIEVQSEEGSSGDLVDEIDDQDAAAQSHAARPQSYKKTLATPAVRRLAIENNVDISLISGSGKDGRVMKEDILSFLESAKQRKAHPQAAPAGEEVPHAIPSQPVAPPLVPSSSDRVVPMSDITKAMFKSMAKSLEIPHLGLSDDVVADRLLQLKPLLKEQGMTLLPVFLKAASLALLDFPILNACIADSSRHELLMKADHNIGFAMDTPAGLLVPNVKRVQDKSILQISQEILR